MNDTNELHAAAYERSLKAKKRSPMTIDSYLRSLGMLAEFTKADDIAELGKSSIEEFMADLLEHQKASSAGVHFRNLRAFYSWCVAEEIVDKSPMKTMKEPAATDAPPPIIADADLKALLKACSGTTYEDRRDQAIIRLWCEPGSPRLAEMAGIKVDDLDLRRSMVLVHGKGDKIRAIPFGAKTGTALDRFMRARAKHPRANLDGNLWLSSTQGRGIGHSLTPSGLTQMLRRRTRQAGTGHIHPHQFRHTAADDWKGNGGNDDDAMALFGWSSPEMVLRYGRSARTQRAQRSAQRASRADRL